MAEEKCESGEPARHFSTPPRLERAEDSAHVRLSGRRGQHRQRRQSLNLSVTWFPPCLCTHRPTNQKPEQKLLPHSATQVVF